MKIPSKAFLFVLLAGCLAGSPVKTRLSGTVRGDVIWSGTVEISGSLEIPRGTSLTIEPGTVVRVFPGPAGETGALVIKGDVSAQGTSEAPIVFTSGPPGTGPESWEGIRIDYATGFSFRWTRISHARYGLHIHFSSGELDHCRLDRNLEGARLGRSRVVFKDCLVDNNLSKGISMTDSRNVITGCTITNNRSGLFLFEATDGDRIEGNNLVGNSLYDLRLGDFFTGNLMLKNNWWGPLTAGETPRIDHAPSASQAVVTEPSPRPFPEAGFWDQGRSWVVEWEVKTGGFVDAAPVVDGRLAFCGSWDGSLYAISHRSGEVAWKVPVGSFIDATPVVVGRNLIVPAWDRTVRAFDRETGALRWEFTWPASGYDDHRQASPLVWDNRVLVGSWDGKIYALEPETGNLIWDREIGGAIRARPTLAQDRLVVVSDHGKVAALDYDGSLIWDRTFEEGFRASPLALTGKVIVAGREGMVTALDSDTGQTVWETKCGGVEYASPINYEGQGVVAGTDGNLYFLDSETGRLRMVVPVGAPLYATPAVDDDFILAADTAGKLVALDPDTGLAVRRIKLPGPVQAQPVMVEDLLLIATRAGNFMALRRP